MKRLLVFALCLLSSAAIAQAQRVDGCACGIPTQVPSSWVIRNVTSTYQNAAMDAFNTWNLYVDVLRPSIASGSSSLGDGLNEIYFRDFSTIPGMDSSVIGYTPSLPDTAFGDFNECPIPAGVSCGQGMTEADVWMNVNIDWASTRPAPGDTSLYYQATATHEIGHGLGFHHNWANFSQMNYLPHFSRFLSRADVLAARRQFPGRVKSVVDVATYPFTYDEHGQVDGSDAGDALTLANFSPTSVAPGGKITIKNWTIENLGNGPVNLGAIFFFLTTNPTTITSSAIPLSGFKWDPTLTTWDEDTVGNQFTVPASTPAGTYYVAAVAGYLVGTNLQTDSITYNNVWILPTPLTVGSGSGGTPTTCSPSSTQVCLVGNRFQVSLSFNGQTMQAIQYTATSGLFYVSDRDNIEVLLKMIDACGFNQKFWIYSGGTTDQDIAINVTDTRNGTVKRYTNTKGTAFKTITDSNAFSCP